MLKLVYTCLAVSALALGLLVAITFKQQSFFRGTTSEMMRAIQDDGKVLAADKLGAITQTGNGIVAGYSRGSAKPQWEFRFTRFRDVRGWRNWSQASEDAIAWCAPGCPAAFVFSGGVYRAFDGASAALAEQLSRDGARILEVIAPDRVIADAGGVLTWYSDGESSSMGVAGPSVAEADENGRRVVVGGVDERGPALHRLELRGGTWRAAAPAVHEENLRNICVSPDGREIGGVSDRTFFLGFTDSTIKPVGGRVNGGRCAISDRRTTFVVNPQDQPQNITVSRYDLNGRQLWSRELGALRLISPTGSPLVVARTPNNELTIVDAKSGDALTGAHHVTHIMSTTYPRVGADGSVVVADRDGRPQWITPSR